MGQTIYALNIGGLVCSLAFRLSFPFLPLVTIVLMLFSSVHLRYRWRSVTTLFSFPISSLSSKWRGEPGTDHVGNLGVQQKGLCTPPLVIPDSCSLLSTSHRRGGKGHRQLSLIIFCWIQGLSGEKIRTRRSPPPHQIFDFWLYYIGHSIGKSV